MNPILRWHRFALVAACLLASSAALAYPGLLDSSFGTAGLQRTQAPYAAYADANTSATGIARQPDGKLVVVGPTLDDPFGVAPTRFGIARYLPDGSLDRAFGFDGRVNGGPDTGRAQGVLIDGSNRIVVFGTATVEVFGQRFSRVALARFLPDGAPDATFGTGGTVIAAFGEASSAHAGAFDAAGRIVIAGSSSTSSGLTQAYLVARFGPDGAIDTAFGSGGGAVAGFNAVVEVARAVAVDPQGRIVVAGNSGTSGGGVMRFLPGGTLDPAFGSGGKVVVGAGNPGSEFRGVAIDALGRVVLAGWIGNTERRMAAARLTDTGSPDAAFGTDGLAFAGFPSAFPLMSSAWALHVDAAGRVLLGGESGPSSPSTFSFARFAADGTLDATFGSAGRATVTLLGATGSAASGVRGIAVGPGGTIHFAGYALGRFALGAIDANGASVPSFNVAQGGAPVTTPVRFANGVAPTLWTAVAAQADGRVVAAGAVETIANGTVQLVALTRRLANGAADPTFGGSGEVSLQTVEGRGFALALAPDAAGRFVAAGFTGLAGYQRLSLLRVLADGTRDAAFGSNGEVALSFGPGDAIARALVIDGSGRLVAGGSYFDGTTKRLALARFLANGTLDASFGTAGRVIAAVESSAEIRALAIDAAGRLVAAGRVEATGGALLARFTAAGALDATFGTGGLVTIAGTDASLDAVAIDAAGRINAVGAARGTSGKPEPLLVRVDANGVPATTPGNGAATRPLAVATPAVLRGLALDPQGRLLVTGYSAGRVLLARIDPDTLLPDITWGANAGVTITGGVPNPSGLGEAPLAGHALSLDASGRVVVAGRDTDSLNQPVGLLARYAASTPAGLQPLRVTRVGSGLVTSDPAAIDCGDLCAADFAAGTPVALTALASPGWRFTGWTGACTGTGPNCAVTLDSARNATATFEAGAALPAGSRFANLATRMPVLTGDDVLIGGFILGGALPRTVVVRARGPSLASAGLTGLLPNPTLQLFAGQAVIATNDDWGGAANAAALAALGLEPPGANEAAVLATLSPGAYTAVVSGAASPGGTTGNAIIEIFDTEPLDGRLVNIATRGRVGTGNDVMIAGFVIQGTQPQTVVIRARGPSLAQSGVTGFLANPLLQLFSGSTQLAFSDNWLSSPDATAIAAAGLAPLSPFESALRVTLQPGAYTAIVTGVNGGTGVAIVEVFAQ